MGYDLKMRQLGALVAIFVVVFVLPFLLAGSIASGKFDWAIPPAALAAVWGVLQAGVGRNSWPFVLGLGLLGTLVTIWLSQDAGHRVTAGGSDLWLNVALTLFLGVVVARMLLQRRGARATGPPGPPLTGTRP